jgi:lysophospholipase-2
MQMLISIIPSSSCYLFLLLLLSSSFSNKKNSSSSSSFIVSAMSTPAAAAAAANAASKAASSKYHGALIFLHGLGDTPRGWSHLQNSLQHIKPRLNSNDIKYVFPPAPVDQSITINGGATMPGWFDLYDWPIGIGSKDDRDGLMRSIKQINNVVNKLINDDNIPANKIVIGGFSQGGAVALLACYGNLVSEEDTQHKFAGCVGLSAWLTVPKEVIESGSSTKVDDDVRKQIPLFWGHGTYDDKVLYEQQQFGIEALTNEFGLPYNKITSTQYPMGHESCSKEMNHLAEFLDNVLFEEEDCNKSSEL